jgi:hypothetical protein
MKMLSLFMLKIKFGAGATSGSNFTKKIRLRLATVTKKTMPNLKDSRLRTKCDQCAL